MVIESGDSGHKKCVQIKFSNIKFLNLVKLTLIYVYIDTGWMITSVKFFATNFSRLHNCFEICHYFTRYLKASKYLLLWQSL